MIRFCVHEMKPSRMRGYRKVPGGCYEPFSHPGLSFYGGCIMKRIIDGKRYDTATAERVASWNSGHNYRDFHRVEETLYRTKNGRWFIHGEGGPLTLWREETGQGYCAGEDIRPISEEEARFWLEAHGDPEDVEKWFPVEDA